MDRDGARPGTSLARWSETTPPGPERDASALALLRAAGEGLAAAHAVGLVHRDFKPANVLIGASANGRVCVADFGLARTEASDAGVTNPSMSFDVRGDTTTRSGGIVGTPRYMSPEQHLGMPADARSDQFAFAVSAWEVLAGTPPFGGRTVAEIGENVVRGTIDTRGAGRLPTRVRAVLTRALANDPARRFASMPALLTALDSATRERRWIVWAWAAAVATAIVAVALAPRDACDGTASRDAFAQVWNDDRRDRVATSIRATAVPWAETAVANVDATIAGRIERWVARDVEACDATRTERDATALDRHRICLIRAVDVTDALLHRLEQATDQSAERAVSAVLALPDPRACEELGASDPMDAPLHRKLAVANAAMLAGDYLDATRLATELADEARARERSAITVEALEVAAGAALELGGYDVDAMLSEAHALAIARDLAVPAFTVASRAAIAAANRNDLAAARRWLGHAEAAAARAPTTESRAVELDRTRCRVLEAEGELDRALATCEAALARYEASGLDIQLQHDRLRTNVSNLRDDVGDYETALAMTTTLRDEAERIHGPLHPRTGGMHLNVGTSALHTGDLELAEASFHHAAEIFRVAYGDRHRWVVSALLNLSSVRSQQKDPVGAELYAEQALEACGERRDAVTARALHNLAEARRNQGRAREALALLERVALIEAEVLPAGHLQTATTHHTRGNVLLDLGRLDEAAAELDEALRLRERHGVRDRTAIDASLDRLRRARSL